MSATAERTIEVLAADANEKVRRVVALDAVSRGYYGRHAWLSADEFRIARCLQDDWAVVSSGGSGGLVRVNGDEWAYMPGGGGANRFRHAKDDAMERLKRAGERCEATEWRLLRLWAGQGFEVSDLAASERVRKERVRTAILGGLRSILKGRVYELRRWSVSVYTAR